MYSNVPLFSVSSSNVTTEPYKEKPSGPGVCAANPEGRIRDVKRASLAGI